MCSAANTGVPDLLPNEPGGYSGYSGLFGHKYVAPLISPGGPLKDLNGNIIQDANGNTGFPGFDGMSAAVSLSYAAAMQEAIDATSDPWLESAAPKTSNQFAALIMAEAQ